MRRNCEKHPEIIIDGNGICWKCFETPVINGKKDSSNTMILSIDNLNWTLIPFDDDFIYKTKIKDFDNEKLESIVEVDRKFLFGDMKFFPNPLNGIGLQYQKTIITNKELLEVFSTCHDYVKKLYSEIFKVEVISSYNNGWVFISTPENPHTIYHHHKYWESKFPNIIPEWTWIYYINIPNNLSGDEGKLFLSSNTSEKEDETYKILPKVGDLIVFKSSVNHRIGLNPNSTNNRIVIAGSPIFNKDVK